MINLLSVLLVLVGAFFFFAGTVGLLRFPDFFTRLHAMTKGDNVGLGLVAIGLALQAQSVAALGQIIIVWLLILLSSASSAHLFARNGLTRGLKPWRSAQQKAAGEWRE